MTIHADNKYIKMLSKNNDSTLFTYFFTIVKLFIFIGLGGGLLFGIFQSIRTNSFNGFIDGIMFGFMLAIVTAPILIFIDIYQKFKCYLKYKAIDFSLNQERKFIVEDDYVSVFRKLNEMLNNHKKIEIHNKDMEKGIIEAVSRRSWKSFGEGIKIKLSKISNGKVLVVLSSKPRISITMIDYSKNFENVEMIMNNLN